MLRNKMEIEKCVKKRVLCCHVLENLGHVIKWMNAVVCLKHLKTILEN